ncbi:TRAP transporter small permease [Acuticoccus mangrovi]|uniref:TRAP transporter small permease protein n=1 Tax=Acuticoccus mangrovi TaxID=2796142 RepID=A0A934IP17_9HYPH|nr:TRAP transporter small permease [Acuticoccus mangrovi]MBJ3774954.1 TRAP transporter small permease [Acuticoccus mangrovi]
MASPLAIAQGALTVIDRTVSVLAGIALLVVTMTIFANATGRYTLGVSFLGGEELARLLTVWIAFVAAYVMLRADRHVTIDLVLRIVPPGVERLMRGLTALIGVVVMAYLSWRAYQLTAFSLGTGQLGTTLPVPRGLFFMPVCVGAVLMTIAFAEKLVRAITNTLPPLPALVDPEDTAETMPPEKRAV